LSRRLLSRSRRGRDCCGGSHGGPPVDDGGPVDGGPYVGVPGEYGGPPGDDGGEPGDDGVPPGEEGGLPGGDDGEPPGDDGAGEVGAGENGSDGELAGAEDGALAGAVDVDPSEEPHEESLPGDVDDRVDDWELEERDRPLVDSVCLEDERERVIES